MSSAPAPLPLQGIRILDLSRVLAGPWATQALADLGAEVIKIERPGGGDDTRTWGPPFLKDDHGHDTAEAAYFLAANRGKKSVAIDLAHPEGQALIRALAKRSHAVIENFKVGGLARYGLDRDSLHAVNPALVYCSITGFGQTGPAATQAGYDAMIQARSGLMSLTGLPDDQPGGGPMKIGVALVDILTGLYAALGLVAAIREAEQTGVGRAVDLALLDTAVACLANQAMNHLVGGLIPGRLGTAHPNIVPYQAMATQDGHLMLAVGNDGQFERFCAVADLPALAHDPRFARNRDRVAHRDALLALLEPRLKERPTAAWLAALEAVGVPCGPINTLDQVFADPQVLARGLRLEVPHPLSGTVPLVRSPLRLSGTETAAPAEAPPLLGQHTRGVLGDLLGLTAARLDALTAQGVIG
ncbi:CaiB/BaiF CoA transferase family protein [Pararhodospirillum photometricum]|nr:CaiB/BaiF CoA-transferase family protein [Pararhodospirillum photometricum]